MWKQKYEYSEITIKIIKLLTWWNSSYANNGNYTE